MPGRQLPAQDPAAEAAGRLDALRTGPGAESGGSAPGIAPAIWEDAAGQLTGILEGLATLRQALPALDVPALDEAPAGDPAGEAIGRGER